CPRPGRASRVVTECEHARVCLLATDTGQLGERGGNCLRRHALREQSPDEGVGARVVARLFWYRAGWRCDDQGVLTAWLSNGKREFTGGPPFEFLEHLGDLATDAHVPIPDDGGEVREQGLDPVRGLVHHKRLASLPKRVQFALAGGRSARQKP